jgi:hypothetical protein
LSFELILFIKSVQINDGRKIPGIDNILWNNSGLNSGVKAGIIGKRVITNPKAWTPQGGVISLILCNLCLNGVDNIVRLNNPKYDLKEYKKH